MKAIVLAGGLGTRLHPLTVNLPKPMVPVVNRPLMSYVIELLAQNGFNDISVLLYYQPDVIRNYFGDGKQFGVKLTYVEAQKDFGTAGAVKFACKNMREPILVISADILSDINLAAAVEYHKKKRSFATLVLTRVKNPLPYGIVITHFNGRIKKFLEKPSWSEVFSDTINAGIYILDPRVLDYIPENKSFDFSHDLFPCLLQEKKPIYGYVAKGYWEDIGKLEDYVRCNTDALKGKIDLKPAGKNFSGNNFNLEAGSTVAKSAHLEGAGLLGKGTVVGDNAFIINSAIGKNCRIGADTYIKECILWDGVEIKSGAKLERAVIGNNVKIGAGSTLEEGVVVGNEAEIGRDTHLKPYIKIWPRKVIESGSTVSRNVIWRERWSKSIFGPYGVTGVGNVEITPQFAVALGAAYGSVLGKGARITCSRDSHKASRMIYRALVSGLLSAGVDVSNLEMVPIPVNRYELRCLKSKGGFHIRKSPFDPDIIDIKFFDPDGMDISSASEKKIERLFFAEDFAQVPLKDCGELTYPFHRVAEEYKADLLRCLDQKAIRSSRLKVVIDYAYGSAVQIFPAILGELGLDVVALNAYIDETKITKDQTAFNESQQQLTKIVKSVDADFGVMLDTGGEKIFLCDHRGHMLDGNQTLGVMLQIILMTKKHAAVALPIQESSAFDKLAKKMGGRVVRSKNTMRGMMECAASRKISLLGESFGGFIFPDFMPAFDAILSTCKLIEFFAKNRTHLADLAQKVPPVALRHQEIHCFSESKGRVIRKLIDQMKGQAKTELVDGVKFWQGESWVLVLPDSLRPVMHLYAEADTTKNAQLLLQKFAERINALKEE